MGRRSAKAFLPPLKLTQAEAMAVVLSARLMVRYADKYDPDLAAAFEKLERGPAARRSPTTSSGPSTCWPTAPRDERVQRPRPAPDPGLGRAPGREIDYEPADYDAGAGAADGATSGRTSSSRRSRPMRCT